MNTDIQLAAVVVHGVQRSLLRVPLEQSLQRLVSVEWSRQLAEFVGPDVIMKSFDAGYTPGEDERFQVASFPIPEWLRPWNSQNLLHMEALPNHEQQLDAVRGIVGFVRTGRQELVLFQNFTPSQILEPVKSLFLQGGTYGSIQSRGLTLSDRLAACLWLESGQLVFANFRQTNVILPLGEIYREASELEIRQLLQHPKLDVENMDALAVRPSQWLRKHFAILRDSKVLDKYTPKQLSRSASTVGVTLTLRRGKIVVPPKKAEAKQLLQFLSEELFRGVITDTIYETNSKRNASTP